MKKLGLFLEGMRIALGSLRANKLRTSLTMLGVAIGIFAITIIFTLVNSLNYNLNRNLSNLGKSVVIIYHVPWTNDAMSNWQKYVQRPMVTFAEYQKLNKQLNGTEAINFCAKVRGQTVKYKQSAITQVGVRAFAGGYFEVNNLEVEKGRPFSEAENDAGRPVCIVGYNIAETLFMGAEPVGKDVLLKGKRLRVVGVLEKSGANMFGLNPDDLVFMPYTYAQKIFDMKSRFIDKEIAVRIAQDVPMERVEDEIVGLMRSSRGLRPNAENNFEINRPEMLIKMFSSVTDYLFYGGLFISFFSIVVGGFGIGNIMFSTVKERSFEIGLQKALGATRQFILFQFLFESVMLCLLGGMAGLLLNWAVSQLIQLAVDATGANFELVISPGAIAFGVIISVMIGLVSGFIPSNIASKMDPVESMRA